MIYISAYYLPLIITISLWILIGIFIEFKHKLVSNFLCFGTFVVTLLSTLFYIYLGMKYLVEWIEITF